MSKAPEVKTKVLVVDDSSVMRTLMKQIFQGHAQFELVGVAPDGKIALDKVANLKPDIVTLDLTLHDENGLNILEKIKQNFDVAVVIVSGQVALGSESYQKARQLGADDIISKAAPNEENGPQRFEEQLLRTLKKFIRTTSKDQPREPARDHRNEPDKDTHSPPLARRFPGPAEAHSERKSPMAILAIASSTGGPEALKVLLSTIPVGPFAVVIVQHMTSGFTKAFSQSLNEMTPFQVKEAEAGDELLPGRVLIAPGDQHMEVRRKGHSLFVHLHREPLLHGVRPAADYLFASVAQLCGPMTVGVILTGMGRDGAQGMLRLRQSGSYTFAQDEASCVVFGMPKEAIQLGAIHEIHDIRQLGKEVSKQLMRKLHRASTEKKVS